MAGWMERLMGRVPEAKGAPQTLFALTQPGEASWSARSYGGMAEAGYARNPIVYRCVRLICEAAVRVPLVVEDNGQRTSEHPLLALLARPNPHQSGSELLEAVYAYLQTAGNAYLEAAFVDDQVRGLYGLRPDRMRVIAGKDGWPVGYAYSAGGKTRRFEGEDGPVKQILHMALFHPLDDHYGLAPLEAAQQSLDTHNAAARWNKALLDNAARPSGALVYSVANGNLTRDQFARLKEELEIGFAGATNAGRPMVLEGGLDWKTIAMSPRDMDFIEAKTLAAREIALALGVPPLLLGLPGDNTHANYAEANRALWRQTVIPLVHRVANELSLWLAPAFGRDLRLVPELDGIEALAEDRSALWARIGAADFLSDAEKRAMLGVG